MASESHLDFQHHIGGLTQSSAAAQQASVQDVMIHLVSPPSEWGRRPVHVSAPPGSAFQALFPPRAADPLAGHKDLAEPRRGQEKDLFAFDKKHYSCFIVSFCNIARAAHYGRKHYFNWTIVGRCMSGRRCLLVSAAMKWTNHFTGTSLQFVSGSVFLSDVWGASLHRWTRRRGRDQDEVVYFPPICC